MDFIQAAVDGCGAEVESPFESRNWLVPKFTRDFGYSPKIRTSLTRGQRLSNIMNPFPRSLFVCGQFVEHARMGI